MISLSEETVSSKTDRILLVEIESENDVVNTALTGITRKNSKKRKLRDVFNNNHTDYYHWLPKTDFSEGGFLNFRKLNTLSKANFDEQFEKPSIQISPFFVKDIVITLFFLLCPTRSA